MTTNPAGRLPQFITDGGIETHIIFNMGVELPHFSAFPLNDSAAGREMIRSYYRDYLRQADRPSDGDDVRDRFTIHVVNKTNEVRTYAISPEPHAGATFAHAPTITVAPMSDADVPIFVTMPRRTYEGDFDLHVTVSGGGETRVVRARFVGAKGGV